MNGYYRPWSWHQPLSCLLALNQRMIRLSEKMLCGETVNRYSGTYRYALFCHSFGFILRRKNLALPPQEQSWQDVVKLEPVD